MRDVHLTDWLSPTVALTDKMARRLIEIMPPDIKSDYSNRAALFVEGMITALMGRDWVAQHVFGKVRGLITSQRHSGFFELDETDVITRETKIQRVLDLTELLFNLQPVPGFYSFWKRFRDEPPDRFESTYAELQIAKMLLATGYRFRFVQPSSVPKADYDFELMYPDGLVVCIEAKCRIESGEINPNAILSKLGKARKQLPKDIPGIVLFKVPQRWFEHPKMGETLRKLTLKFLGETQTIVSVKFYVSVVELDTVAKTTSHKHAYDEIINLNTKFSHRNWFLFSENSHVPEWRFLRTYFETVSDS